MTSCPHFSRTPARLSYLPWSRTYVVREERHLNAALCRAAENTCYFATVNFAGLDRRPLRR